MTSENCKDAFKYEYDFEKVMKMTTHVTNYEIYTEQG